jgi:DNA-binding beta-propeller fold protein YncE
MESISDLQWYNGNLYVLTASGNQIVKMRPQGNGYEAGTPWITSTLSGTTLSSARALAIDGNIYVLSGSKINSFLSGREQTFETDDISPIMDNATDITATDDNEYIYILEPDEKRVIVFDKQGKLVAQYINDELANALSIFVRETSIIVLTKTGAFSFAANHLLK